MSNSTNVSTTVTRARRIARTLIKEGISQRQTAVALNVLGLVRENGQQWNHQAVARIVA